MKKISITVALCLYIFSLLSACSGSRTEWVEIKSCTYFDDNSFDRTHHLQSTIFDSTIIQNPVRIALNDTILFSLNPSYGLDTLIYYFSTESHRCLGAIAPRGNGPEEFLSVANMSFSPDSDSFWIYDVNRQAWAGKHLSALTEGKQEEYRVINLRDTRINGLTNPFWIGDDFVASSLFKYKERFFVFDSMGVQKKSIINKNLEFIRKGNEGVLADIFSTHLTVTPDRETIILAGRYLDLLEIYNADGSIQKMIKGPQKDFNLEFDQGRSSENSTLVKTPETRRAYLEVKATNDRFYALYSGKAKKDKEHYSYSRMIYSFTREGEPLDRYVLDVPIIDFVINKSQDKMYAISIDSEIVSFDLK